MNRGFWFGFGLIIVAACGLIVALIVTPDTSPATAPIPAARATPTVSTCERALLANLAIAQRALVDYRLGHAADGRDLYLSRTAALPVGCGR